MKLFSSTKKGFFSILATLTLCLPVSSVLASSEDEDLFSLRAACVCHGKNTPTAQCHGGSCDGQDRTLCCQKPPQSLVANLSRTVGKRAYYTEDDDSYHWRWDESEYWNEWEDWKDYDDDEWEDCCDDCECDFDFFSLFEVDETIPVIPTEDWITYKTQCGSDSLHVPFPTEPIFFVKFFNNTMAVASDNRAIYFVSSRENTEGSMEEAIEDYKNNFDAPCMNVEEILVDNIGKNLQILRAKGTILFLDICFETYALVTPKSIFTMEVVQKDAYKENSFPYMTNNYILRQR